MCQHVFIIVVVRYRGCGVFVVVVITSPYGVAPFLMLLLHLSSACYGIVQVPTGPWFCRKCESQERAARVVSIQYIHT